jgi:hypothetical protein
MLAGKKISYRPGKPSSDFPSLVLKPGKHLKSMAVFIPTHVVAVPGVGQE